MTPTRPPFCSAGEGVGLPESRVNIVAELARINCSILRFEDAVGRIATAIETIAAELNTKQEACPTCSRVSGHQSWCGRLETGHFRQGDR